MLRFPFEEGGVLRELKIVEALFRQLCQLTETSIKIVSDQLTIVDITLLSPQEFSYVVRLFALRKLNLDFSSSKTVQIVGSRDIDTRQLNSCQQWLDDVAMWEIWN
ncbi:hypothetical protein ACFX10_000136 [Malus domestica]